MKIPKKYKERLKKYEEKKKMNKVGGIGYANG